MAVKTPTITDFTTGFPEFANVVNVDVAASGLVSIVINPVDGDTVTINGTAITFKALGASGNVQVNIAATPILTTAALLALLMAHPIAGVVVAAVGNTGISITASVVGAAGNSIVLLTSDAAAIVLSGATLSGGTAANISGAMLQGILDFCASWWSVADWGRYYFRVVLLDAAHRVCIDLIRQSAPNGGYQVPAGPVSSIAAAGISTSFSVQALDKLKSGSREWYQATSYGRELIRLRDTVISPVYVSCGNTANVVSGASYPGEIP